MKEYTQQESFSGKRKLFIFEVLTSLKTVIGESQEMDSTDKP